MASRSSDPYTAFALGVSSIIISHPCTVLRRQCQVHQLAKKLHLTPFTYVPVVCHIISNDGILALWKGSVGSGVLWALSQVTELVFADVFNLPKNIIPDGSRERFWKHSGTGFSTKDDTRLLDVITRGLDRLRFDLFGVKDSSKRFSIMYLSFPTTIYYTGHFLLAQIIYQSIYGMARNYVVNYDRVK